MKSRSTLCAAVILFINILFLAPAIFAQSSDGQPAAKNAAVPVVSFELKWPEADPNWWTVTVDQTGAASYQSKGKPDANETALEPEPVKFTASEATTKQIFALAKNLNYFQGQFEYHGGNIAKTGVKTLRYQAGAKSTETSFNFSENNDIMDLASMFQKISTTIEFGRRIEFKLRFDKLGLDAELKGMEMARTRGALLEVQAVAPILQKVLNDRGTMNISRNRIQHILAPNSGGK